VSNWWVSFTRGVPLEDSSADRQQTDRWALHAVVHVHEVEPFWANCTSISGVHSRWPGVHQHHGRATRLGDGVAMQERITPGSRPMRSSAEAIVAPVFRPDHRTGCLANQFGRGALARSPFLAHAGPGSSSMVMTSLQANHLQAQRAPMSSGTRRGNAQSQFVRGAAGRPR